LSRKKALDQKISISLRHDFRNLCCTPLNQLRMKSLILVLAVPFALMEGCNKKNKTQDNPPTAVEIKDSVLVQNLTHVWEITWGPDNFIWMTERGGRVSRVNPTTGSVIPLLTISEVVTNNEGGLLGMALHPDFSTTPYVFVEYDYNSSSGYKGKVVRYIYNGSTLINPLTIIDNIEAAANHNGCRLLISPDKKLFISIGDADNENSYPQNTSSLNGKILRINLDGSIPSDNPIVGNPLWTMGHRNPQGLVFANNILYSSEHGTSNNDEINIIEKGRNYGWPNVQGYCDGTAEQTFCSANNVKEPIKAWTPTIAPCGLDYYDKNEIPQWKNSLLLVTLKNARLYQMKLNDSYNTIIETNEYFTNKYGRMRDLCISPAGKVYIGTSNGSNDKIIVLSKK
jgi:glucose/arabinose dehydrogenase